MSNVILANKKGCNHIRIAPFRKIKTAAGADPDSYRDAGGVSELSSDDRYIIIFTLIHQVPFIT